MAQVSLSARSRAGSWLGTRRVRRLAGGLRLIVAFAALAALLALLDAPTVGGFSRDLPAPVIGALPALDLGERGQRV